MLSCLDGERYEFYSPNDADMRGWIQALASRIPPPLAPVEVGLLFVLVPTH